MKSTQVFLSELDRLDVQLWVEGDRLRCNAPKGALTPELKAELATRKAEIIQWLQISSPDSIKPIARIENLPLSFSQQRLWFLAQLETENAIYNESAALQLKGNLNREAIKESWQEIIRRHEVLRTTFKTVKGVPVVKIDSNFNIELPLVNFQGFSEAKQLAQVEQFVTEEIQKPFNLSQGPLWRVMLLKLAEDHYILLVTMHHIICDGWSFGIMTHELSVLYQAFSAGKTSPLPELPIQYVDFASWQQQWLEGEVLETQLSYWKQQLADIPSLLQLPTDFPRSSVQTFSGASHSFAFTQELTQKLKTLSQQSDVTLFMTLVAGLTVLLSRYSGQEDIAVGSPIAGRNRKVIESLIGCFINTLVLRTNLSENPSFSELLSQVRQVCLEAYAHQDIPFEKLVEVLQPERNLSHPPLFQVMFVLQNAPMDKLELPDLILSSLDLQSHTTKFDLTLSVEETESELRGTWEYNRDLFTAETIQRMSGHFQTLLEAIIATPEQQISTLSLLTDAERYQLLVEWNDTKADYPDDKCIHQLVEEQVKLNPDAIAVVFEDQQLTYRELNEKANQLAHYLQKLDVKPEMIVGICVQRSLEMVVGLLGILKAGAAYLPLDPIYPQERLNYMLSDAQVKVLLTQQSLLPQFTEIDGCAVCLDTHWEKIASEKRTNPLTQATPQNLAYVIYTSGSTGKPKGVLIPHQGLLNLVFWHQKAFLVTSSDRGTQLAGVAFDASVWELWPYLSAGASVYLVPPDIVISSVHLRNWLCEQKITITFVPTPLAEALLSLEWPMDVALRIMLTGGDKLHQYPPANLPFHLVNNYGPTENTVVTTSGRIFSVQQEEILPSIGKPIDNSEVYLLDRYLKVVPIGVPGELYIGGKGLAQGYLNRPDLTAEKFIPHPFNPQSGSRLYRTGDLARYLPDGSLEFLGRIDDQVKIRGFRIELGEIEAALSQHPHVRESIVIIQAEQTDNKLIVAYTVISQNSLTSHDLRDFLKKKLPDYMVPSVFIILDSLPLTPNGKVDRRALPAPDITRDSEVSFVAPQTPTEEILGAIWSEVLNVKPIGIHDNFFALGGHSLIATQVMSRLRDSFSVELPLRSLFEFPTLNQLSQQIESARQAEANLAVSDIQPIPRQENLPLSFAQQRLWFLDRLEGENATYNMPGVLHLRGVLNQIALEQSLNAIVERHEILRTNFKEVNGSPVQVIESTATVHLVLIDLQGLPDNEQSAEVKRLSIEEAQRPFQLSQGSLLRTTLLQLDPDSHVLLVTMHHIVSDGWSMEIFIRELSALYGAFSTGTACSLLELPIQYADFAYWQRHWLAGSVRETQLQYWRQQLAGSPSCLTLPTDKPRPPVQTFHGHTEVFTLNQKLSQDLESLSQKSGTTLFMSLLTAFGIFLYRYSGQEDIVIGSPIANRNRQEIEPLIGFFVNTLALRIDLAGNPPFSELLRQVRQIALDGYANQDLPFEQVVEDLNPERNPSYSPLFQIMFDLQKSPLTQMELPGLAVTPLKPDNATAKFDLSLTLEQTDQGLIGEWEYNTDLFESGTITRMIGHFQTLLESIVANPQQRIAELPLLTQTERHQLLVKWNNTQSNYPIDKCIHQLFEEQVEKTPDAVAVVFEEQQLTYRQLNARANQLAHHLKTLGVQPDVLVGICVQRSLEMVVGLLGILKAGGAYVPLDPDYPQERLAYMLSDAQVSVLVTQAELAAQLLEHRIPVIRLDADWTVISQESQENPVNEVKPENLAYLIYTSGSTGKPKGVMIQHQSLVNFTQMATVEYKLSQIDRILQFASISFDAAAEEIYPCLTCGATLVLRTEEMLNSLATFMQRCQDWKLTVLDLPTAYWHQLTSELEATHLELPESLRLVIIGGEAALRDRIEIWQRLVGSKIELVNTYGPTEGTVVATTYKISEAALASSQVPIGCPLGNVQTYILDRCLNPVPIGVAGELHIGGVGLARGYLNREELTKEKFIANPFSERGESRLYKTGDLVRYRKDGNIEFLGRIDEQVKIRGFRIELAEIEFLLNQHPGVGQSIVIDREDEPGNKRLVAYVVSHQEQANISEWRTFLADQLPNYMIPSAFVLLDSLPLTPNGKVDRRALPTPDISYRNLEADFVAPRDPLELQLAQIWSEILGVCPVGVQDNFFELGGHSFLAVRLMAQIQQQFGKTLPLTTLFQSPTIEHLASLLHQQTDVLPWSSLIPIQPKGSKIPFYCVPGAGGNVIYLYDLARHLGSDQPFYGLQAVGLDGESEPHTSVEDMAAYYVKIIREIQPEGPYLLGGHSFGGQVAFEMAQQMQKQGQEVALVVIFDATAPISSNPETEVNLAEAQWLTNLGSLIESWLEISLEMSSEVLESLTPDEQLKYLKERLQQVNLLPPELDDLKQVRGLVQVFKANQQAYYFPQEVIPTRLTLFRSSEVNLEDGVSEEFSQILQDPTWGWSRLSIDSVEIYNVPGNHMTMMAQPHVQILAEQLKFCLDNLANN